LSDSSILIVDHDPSWPALYEREKRILLSALENQLLFAEIERIGSTAAPDLAAKPIIDISC
jgi:GrpB-like predicted nucleotidyltransferase (UPF0157 family)